MKRRLGRWLLVALAAGALAATAPSAEAQKRTRAAANDEREVRELVSLINARRRNIGCRPLTWDARVAAVATRHSRDMVRRRYFAHESPGGRTPFDRLDLASIPWRRAAENIASGQTTAREVFDAWMESPGHRKNIEDCAYTHHGIGRYGDRWTHVFVRPPDRERRRR